jgi:hypothetical protein
MESTLLTGNIAGYNQFEMKGPSRERETAQERALKNYRKRLGQRGMARFEVLGRDADRELIRSLARKLADDGLESERIRATVQRTIAGNPPTKGGILSALRRSPLVGAQLDVKRPVTTGRRVDF